MSTGQPVAQRLQDTFCYHPNCNKKEGVVNALATYSRNTNSKIDGEELQKKIPKIIDLRASAIFQSPPGPDGERTIQHKFHILSSLHMGSLERDLIAVQEKGGKTQPLRKVDLSFLTAVFDRAGKHVLFVYPVCLLNPDAFIPKNKDAKKPDELLKPIDVKSVEIYQFYVVPPKFAAQMFISLYIHNNPDSTMPKTSHQVRPLFTAFEASWSIILNNPTNGDESMAIELSTGCYFPHFPSIFMNPQTMESVKLTATDYILKPGEVVEKNTPAADATKKRGKRPPSASSDHEDEEDYNTIPLMDVNDKAEFAAGPKRARGGKSTKTPEKIVEIQLEDDDGETTESKSTPRNTNKRQATVSKKTSTEAVPEKRLPANKIAGSLMKTAATDENLDTDFLNEDLPLLPIPQQKKSSSSSSSPDSEESAMSRIVACANMEPNPESLNNLTNWIGEKFNECGVSLDNIFTAIKTPESLRKALAASLKESLEKVSQKSLQDTNPAWVGNPTKVADKPTTRVATIKKSLGVPEDMRLHLGTYSLLMQLVQDDNTELQGHLEGIYEKITKPPVAAAEAVFVPMTPTEVPVGESMLWYNLMLYQGSHNIEQILKLVIKNIEATYEAFGLELGELFADVEKKQKMVHDALSKARHRQIKLAKHTLLLLDEAAKEKEKALADRDSEHQLKVDELQKRIEFLEAENIKLRERPLNGEKGKPAPSLPTPPAASKPKVPAINYLQKSQPQAPKAPAKPLSTPTPQLLQLEDDDPIDDFENEPIPVATKKPVSVANDDYDF
jgi:hypothetical protein